MSITATIYINKPPRARWTGHCIELSIQTGDVEFTRILTRHAATGLLKELQRELATADRGGARRLRQTLAEEL